MTRSRVPVCVALGAVAFASGCGGSTPSTTPTTSQATTTASGTTNAKPASGGGSTSSGAGALEAEANSAATGDIPDNQVFLTFRNRAGRYSIKYPEGWARRGSGDRVMFRDKNNIVRIVVAPGTAPTAAQVRVEMRRLGAAKVTRQPAAATIGGARAVKVVYTTASSPNPVTGKRVTLVVDRYYLGRSGRLAIVDLGTPQGVDNVDAYRLMIQSFRWR